MNPGKSRTGHGTKADRDQIEKRLEALCEKILSFFDAGFEITTDISHQLSSMFGFDAEKDLARLFDDPEFMAPDSTEAEILCDLVCFPGIDFQATIEPLLFSGPLREDETASLADMICATKPVARFFLPAVAPGMHVDRVEKMHDLSHGTSGKRFYELEITSGFIGRFLKRLRLLRDIDAAVARAASDRFERSCRISDPDCAILWDEKDFTENPLIQSRVILRNGRFRFTGEVVSFLCALFENIPDEASAFIYLLSNAVDFLDQRAGSGSLQDEFMRYRLHLLKMIRAAERTQERLNAGPMEAHMLSRTPMPAIDTAATLRRISALDRIGLAVYGSGYIRKVEF